MKPYDYSSFRLNRLTQPQFRHLLLLLYWPLYGAGFYLLESMGSRNYHPIYCPLDDLIPFCEWFFIPYLFWFVSIVWIMIYSFFFDIDAFKKFNIFVIITYTLALVTYIIYPSQQNFRPEEFTRDNFLIDMIKGFYSYDTNTNVFPSVHVMGAFAVFFTAWHSIRYSTVAWRIFFTVVTVLVTLSTVFMRQHSVLDVIFSLIVCFIAYPFVYLRKNKKSNPEKELLHK